MSDGINAQITSRGSSRRSSTFLFEPLETRRLLSAGQIDPTFGNQGYVDGKLISGGSAYATALQADGGIIAAGATGNFPNGQFALARFKSDGSVDRAFGTGGRVITDVGGADQGIAAVAVQKDGKIVAAGFGGNGKNISFALARYLPSGKLDKTFGSGGIDIVSFSGTAEISALAIQPDGKIDVAGFAENTLGQQRFALARFTTSGQLDQTFGTHGIVATSFAGGGFADALVVAPGGDLIVGGGSGDGVPAFTLARYDSHGKLDPTFANHGIDITHLGDGAFKSLALKSNGQIIAGGGTYEGSMLIARFQHDGSLDHSFGKNGVADTGFNPGAQTLTTLLVQSTGNIVAVGTELQINGDGSGSSAFVLTRLTPAGKLDTSFAIQGSQDFSLPGNDAQAFAAVLGPNDRIVVAGESFIGDSGSDFALARYTRDGQFDTSFGFQGAVQQANGITGPINATLVQPDGKIIVAGTENAVYDGADEAALARYNADGSLDTTFGVDGRIFLQLSNIAEFDALALDSTGNIIVAGLGGDPEGYTVSMLARFHSDGTADRSFGDHGVALSTINDPFVGRISNVAVLSDGDIITAGLSDTGAQIAVARFLPGGKVDASFGSGGTFLLSGPGDTLALPHAMAIQSNGRILVAGSINNEFGFLRLMPNGTLDKGFGTGGVVITDFSGSHFGGDANAILIDAAGNIVVGGVGSLNGPASSEFALARYSSVNGKLDPTFGKSGKVTLVLPGDIVHEIHSLALQKDGKIIAGGVIVPFVSDVFLAMYDSAVLRFTTQGKLDSSFGSNGVALTGNVVEIGPVNNLFVKSNGEILGLATDLFLLTGK